MSDLVRGRGHEFPAGTARPPLCRVVPPSGHLVNVSPPKESVKSFISKLSVHTLDYNGIIVKRYPGNSKYLS